MFTFSWIFQQLLEHSLCFLLNGFCTLLGMLWKQLDYLTDKYKCNKKCTPDNGWISLIMNIISGYCCLWKFEKVLWAGCLWQNEPSPNQNDHIVLGQKQYILLATRCHKN